MTRDEYELCQRKKIYFDEEPAKQAIVRLFLELGESGLEVFPCRIAPPDLPHLHIGHARTSDWYTRFTEDTVA